MKSGRRTSITGDMPEIDAEIMTKFYNSLSKRNEANQISTKNEEIKIDYTNVYFDSNRYKERDPKLWLGVREVDSPSKVERKLLSPQNVNFRTEGDGLNGTSPGDGVGLGLNEVMLTPAPVVVPTATGTATGTGAGGRRGANAGRKTIVRPPNKMMQAEETARYVYWLCVYMCYLYMVCVVCICMCTYMCVIVYGYRFGLGMCICICVLVVFVYF